jgi:elongation factor Tu
MKILTKLIARSAIAIGTLMGLGLLCATVQAGSISLGEPDGAGDRLNISEGYSIAENQTPNLDAPFLLPIEDAFTITGRGTVVTGTIESGIIKVGEEVEVVGAGRDGRDTRNTTVTEIQMFRKRLDLAEAGNPVEILLRGIKKEDIERGMVIAKPGSIKAHTKFEAAVYILKPEEGGRKNTIIREGSRPVFRLRTADVAGTMFQLRNTDGSDAIEVKPGDNANITVELIRSVPIADGLEFDIRDEGGRKIGSGKIMKIIE